MLKLFRHLRPYALPLAGVLLLVFFQSLADLALPTLMADIVNGGIVKGDTRYILITGGWMLLVTAGGMVCAIFASYLSSLAAAGFGRDLRRKLFTHVQDFSLTELDRISTPSLITRNTNDVNQVQMVTIFLLRMAVSAPIMIAGGLVMALSKDVALSWVILAVLPFIAILVAVIFGNATPLFKALQKKLDGINLVLREGLSGIRVIRAFDRTEHQKDRFEAVNDDLKVTSTKVFQIMSLMMPAMMLIMNVATIAILWFGSVRADLGEMNVGDVMAFLQYAMMILFSLVMASMVFVMVPRAQASAQRINEVLEIVPVIADAPDAAPAGLEHGRVEFRNVGFRYHGAEECAIRGVSFRAEPGEVTAIIGGTGSGKTTLVNLIPRFYDSAEGEVLVDGKNVREQPQESLRERIGFVPQKAVLFSGSVAENIRFGKTDATDDEVKRAAQTAQADEFIETMAEKYDSMVSQGATNLSGGQKQRLAIARALVRKPGIYVFDDSFSALDFRTDAQLRSALRRETKDATVILIGQRVATIRDADRIIVMDEGQVAGIGKHEELMKSCEVYREIVYSQLSEEEIA